MSDYTITLDCNNNCRFCIRHSILRYVYIQPGDFKRLLEEEHPRAVTLTGGEVTLLPSLNDILQCCREKGVGDLAIITNGRSLSDRRLLDNLISRGVNHIGISLYSIEPKIHDFLTGVKGSGVETIDGIKNAVAVSKHKKTITLRVNILLNSYNIKTVFSTVEALYRQGIRDFLFLSIAGNRHKDFFINYKNVVRFYLELSSQKQWQNALFSFRGYPLCIFSDFIKKDSLKQQAVILKSNNSSRFKAEAQDFLTHNLGRSNKLDKYEKLCQDLFIRLKSCSCCNYKHFCPGVLKDYWAKFRNLY